MPQRSLLLLLSQTLLLGACMTDNTINWEWPGGRAPDKVVRVRVLEVTPESRRWFGIGNSPSLANAIPDPVRIRVEPVPSVEQPQVVLASDTLRIPKLELGKIEVGATVDLSLLGPNVVIALTPASAN